MKQRLDRLSYASQLTAARLIRCGGGGGDMDFNAATISKQARTAQLLEQRCLVADVGYSATLRQLRDSNRECTLVRW